MILLHPLGIEEREMDRVPWVSISIAALCAVLFAVTWLIPPDPMGGGPREALFEYWAEACR